MEEVQKQAITKQKQGLNTVSRIEAGNSKSSNSAEAGVKKSTGEIGKVVNKSLRTKRVEICFSPVEFLNMVELAKKNGFKNNAEFLRNSVFNGVGNPSNKEQILAVMRFEKSINRIGNNFNQIAKQLNGGGKMEQLIVENMVSALKDLKKLHAEARESVLKNVSGEGRDH